MIQNLNTALKKAVLPKSFRDALISGAMAVSNPLFYVTVLVDFLFSTTLSLQCVFLLKDFAHQFKSVDFASMVFCTKVLSVQLVKK